MKQYITPFVEFIECETEGLLCTSGENEVFVDGGDL